MTRNLVADYDKVGVKKQLTHKQVVDLAANWLSNQITKTGKWGLLYVVGKEVCCDNSIS